jgi:putative transposase
MGLRTYRLKHGANKGKVDKVMAVFPDYRRLAKQIARVQWNLFFTTGAFDRNLAPLSGIGSPLSERYKQTCQYQVVGMLESFTSNLSNHIRDMISGSSLDEETRLKLFFVNKNNLWYSGEVSMPLFVEGKRLGAARRPVEPEVLKLARLLFKQALRKHSRPSFGRINLSLDDKVAKVLPREGEGASLFPYWLKVSTLEKGRPVMIPLRTNHYFDNVDGNLKKFCFINQRNDGLEFCLVKDKAPIPYEPLTDELHLDWGLSVPFATQYGDLYGRDFFSELKKRDEILTDLARNRQRQGLNVSSRRYRSFRRRTAEYIRNELCRILNRAVESHRPAKIVVEKLDMRSPGLSKRMNRLLSTCGRKCIEDKLSCLAEDYGIEVAYVNPAYTSIECSNCGWARKSNRKSRELFVCNHCGFTIHADVNGSRVIGRRSSTPLASPFLGRDAVLNALRDSFLARVERYPHWPYLDVDSGECRHSPAGGSLPGDMFARQSPKRFCGVGNGIP